MKDVASKADKVAYDAESAREKVCEYMILL